MDGRWFGAHGRYERPLFLPGCAFLDPAADDLNLLRGQRLVRALGRHAARGRGGRDALIQQAVRGLCGNDGRAILALAEDAFRRIQPEIHHARVLVGAVTLKAIIRQDGPDLPLKVDG